MSESIKTVLVVDDETSIRQSLDNYGDHLWRSLQVESGEQVLELLENKSPDGVVVENILRIIKYREGKDEK